MLVFISPCNLQRGVHVGIPCYLHLCYLQRGGGVIDYLIGQVELRVNLADRYVEGLGGGDWTLGLGGGRYQQLL